MLYFAIDQHKHHLTINVRNEQGDVPVRLQVFRIRTFSGRS